MCMCVLISYYLNVRLYFLFRYSGNVSVDDVLDAAYFPDVTQLTSGYVKFLYRYLQECNHDG